jgi:hypothetical protein
MASFTYHDAFISPGISTISRFRPTLPANRSSKLQAERQAAPVGGQSRLARKVLETLRATLKWPARYCRGLSAVWRPPKERNVEDRRSEVEIQAP